MQVLQKRQRLLCDCPVIEHGTRMEWRIARTGDQGEDGASEARKSPMAALANCHLSTGLEVRTHHFPSLHCIYCRFGTLQHTAPAPAASPHQSHYNIRGDTHFVYTDCTSCRSSCTGIWGCALALCCWPPSSIVEQGMGHSFQVPSLHDVGKRSAPSDHLRRLEEFLSLYPGLYPDHCTDTWTARQRASGLNAGVVAYMIGALCDQVLISGTILEPVREALEALRFERTGDR